MTNVREGTHGRVMMPGDERWGIFCVCLSVAVSEWKCDGTSLRLAKRILDDPGWMGYDVDLSLQFFGKHGGYCDCEVLMNVEDNIKRTAELN